MNPQTSNINHSPQRPAPGLEEMLHRPHITPPSPIAVRPQQAAEMIGVSERTLRELMRRGEIPFAKLDRAVLIAVSDLIAFIDRRTEKGGGELVMPLKNGNSPLASEGGAETTEHLQHTRFSHTLPSGAFIHEALKREGTGHE